MKAVLLFVGVVVLFGIAHAQKVLSGKEIYRASHNGIVYVLVDGNFSGTGFVVSADGLVVTANHVVTMRESKFKTYRTGIEILTGRGRFPATPIETTIPDDQVNFDFAILKINAANLTPLQLGSWDEVDIGDRLAIIPGFPGMGAPLLEAFVSNKGTPHTDLGSKEVRTILFQSPVRNGFSGAPIFAPSGNVVGIVSTKVFGITSALDKVRQGFVATRSHGSVAIMGVDVPSAFIEVVDVLDQNLISGLGSAVDIGYAKQALQAHAKATKK